MAVGVTFKFQRFTSDCPRLISCSSFLCCGKACAPGPQDFSFCLSFLAVFRVEFLTTFTVKVVRFHRLIN